MVLQLRRRLATQGREARGRNRSSAIDVHRTMRASLQTGGVPLDLHYRPRRPRRPELYGREPHAAAFGAIAQRAGRTFWMNPEPKLYWNYGDSVMSVYEPHCTGVFECWTTRQLESFVNALADLRPAATA